MVAMKRNIFIKVLITIITILYIPLIGITGPKKVAKPIVKDVCSNATYYVRTSGEIQVPFEMKVSDDGDNIIKMMGQSKGAFEIVKVPDGCANIAFGKCSIIADPDLKLAVTSPINYSFTLRTNFKNPQIICTTGELLNVRGKFIGTDDKLGLPGKIVGTAFGGHITIPKGTEAKISSIKFMGSFYQKNYGISDCGMHRLVMLMTTDSEIPAKWLYYLQSCKNVSLSQVEKSIVSGFLIGYCEKYSIPGGENFETQHACGTLLPLLPYSNKNAHKKTDKEPLRNEAVQ
jgi:hypothetical protein